YAREKGRHKLKPCPAPDGRQSRTAAASRQRDITGSQTGYESRRAADENGLGVDAILCKHSLLICDPERKNARIERCVAHGNFEGSSSAVNRMRTDPLAKQDQYCRQIFH